MRFASPAISEGFNFAGGILEVRKKEALGATTRYVRYICTEEALTTKDAATIIPQ